MTPPRAFWILLAALLTLMNAAPSLARQPDEPVSVEVRALKSKAAPGDTLPIAVILDHQPGWHTHTHAPKPPAGVDPSTLIATEIKTDFPAGVVQWPTQWPKPHATSLDIFATGKPESYEVYEGRAIAYIPIRIPADAVPGSTLELKVSVAFQACNDRVCIMPDERQGTVTLDIVTPPSPSTPPDADFAAFDPTVFATPPTGATAPSPPALARAASTVTFQFFGLTFSLDPSKTLGLTLLLLVAALGGALLNFTPCVLPVVPLKILGLSQVAGSPGRCFYLGLMTSLGVIAFWLAIGGAIAFISGFSAISTLFRTPWFSLGVGVFILIMATGMLGAFAVRLPQAVYMINPSHETAGGSVGFGVMTAVLSTPCTAPFMGTAAAWAATQNPAITLATFTAIGVGMALPYLVLSANPRLVSRIPRTGPGSELLKQVMGLLMLAVAAFFLGIGLVSVIPGAPPWAKLAYWWVVAFFCVFAAAWLIVRTFQITRSSGKRAAVAFLGATFAAVAVYASVTFALPTKAIPWQDYSPDVYARHLANRKVVVLDFTADWCLNCKTIEAAVLHRKAVVQALNVPEVVPIKVDLTSKQAAGWQKLKEFNELGIPLLVVMVPGSPDPIFKSNAYTVDQVLDAIARGRAQVSRQAAAGRP